MNCEECAWMLGERLCWLGADCGKRRQRVCKYLNRERQYVFCVCGEPSQTTKGTARAWEMERERKEKGPLRSPVFAFSQMRKNCRRDCRKMKICGWQFVRHLPDWLKKKCQICVRAQNIKAGASEQQIKKEQSDKRTQNCLLLLEQSLFSAGRPWIVTYFLVGSGDEFQGAPWCTALPGIVAQKYFIIFSLSQPACSEFISHRWRTNLRFHATCLGFSLLFIKYIRILRYQTKRRLESSISIKIVFEI